jgi:spore coat-associated protein N
MKKVLLGLISVALCIGMTGSAFAYFTDVATSTGNTFTAGTLAKLQISDSGRWDPDGWATTVDHTWEMSTLANGPMIPGVSEVTNNAQIQELGGTIPSNHIEIALTDNIIPTTLLPQALGQWLEVTQMMYADVNLFKTIKNTIGWDVNNNGFLDLDDIVRSLSVNAPGGPLDNLPPPHVLGGMASLSMTVAFNAGAPNSIQGATLTLVVTFTLNQSASQ